MSYDDVSINVAGAPTEYEARALVARAGHRWLYVDLLGQRIALKAAEEILELRAKLSSCSTEELPLTPHERVVMNMVLQGRTNKQVAITLGRSEKTVKGHMTSILKHAQVKSRAELIVKYHTVSHAS